MDKDYLMEAIQDASAKLKVYKPGTDEYKDALRAFTELNRIYNERFKNENQAEIDKREADRKRAMDLHEIEMDARKYEAERSEKREELRIEQEKSKGSITPGMIFNAAVGALMLTAVLNAESVGIITSRALTSVLRKVI